MKRIKRNRRLFKPAHRTPRCRVCRGRGIVDSAYAGAVVVDGECCWRCGGIGVLRPFEELELHR